MKGYRRIFPESRIDDDKEYVVIASFKDGDGSPFVKSRGTYDECAAYAERNESDDNVETYYVAEAVTAAMRADHEQELRGIRSLKGRI